MAEEFARVQRADLGAYERVIAVSDIHGDCRGFEGMLKAVGFGDKDALVIVGDILERGRESLPLLKRIVCLSQTGRVYAVIGNNDASIKRWFSGTVDDMALRCLHSGEDTVIREMAQELAMPYETLEDVAALRESCCERYGAELAYLESLPHILDSELATFVHAGIKPGDLHTQSAKYCLTTLEFSEQGYRFDKPVVVGHWPSSNYSAGIIDVGVHFNREANIYSIDGGNSMKNWGQINILTFERGGKIVCSSYDRLNKVRVLQAQENTEEPLTLLFPKTCVEVLEDLGDKKRCYVPYLGREMLFAANRIYTYKGKTYSWDFTTYHLPVKAGEIVTFCGENEDGILIKRNGIVGKYVGRYETIETTD